MENRLTLVKVLKKTNIHRKKLGVYVCKCGTEKIYTISLVKTNKTRSCGCLQREAVRITGFRNKTHGSIATREYRIWASMKSRCTNKNDNDYKNYGGRGIGISREWLDSFEKFIADMGKAPHNSSIDRINNNCDYSKENCRWATSIEQSRNKSNTVLTIEKFRLIKELYEYDKKAFSVKWLCKCFSVKPHIIYGLKRSKTWEKL